MPKVQLSTEPQRGRTLKSPKQLSSLVLIHRRRENCQLPFQFSNPEWTVWETCVRRIALGHVSFGVEQSQLGDEIYVGNRAFRFLLETVCGLHSPVRGETEVHGQFRQFLSSIEEISPSEKASSEKSSPKKLWLRPVLQYVHTQARRVRDEFLRDLGSQSYGSLARRKLRKCESIDIIGGGQLVRDVIPWLLKMQKPIRVWVRSPEKMQWLTERIANGNAKDCEILPLTAFADLTAADRPVSGLIIAASIEAANLNPWLASDVSTILDFRAESTQDRIAHSGVVTLTDMFAEIEKTQNRVDQQAQRALDYIGEISQLENSQPKEK